MRTILIAAMASALVASPAFAQSVTDDQANAMIAAMNSSAFDFCTDSEKAEQRPAIEQYNACQTALTELAQVRKKNPKATPGEREVYDFYEAAIQMGNTLAMLRVDNSPTARVCTNIENQWTAANRTNGNVVGPQLREAQQMTIKAVQPLVKLCRERFAAPSGATPL